MPITNVRVESGYLRSEGGTTSYGVLIDTTSSTEPPPVEPGLLAALRPARATRPKPVA